MQKQFYARLRKARRAKKAGNKQCADCRTSNTTWTSFSLGIFLCMHCAGVHRSLGTHLSKVKSSTTDAWTEKDVETMESVGNNTANSYWEATLDSNHSERINEFSSPSAREAFIKKKYAERAWVSSDSGGIPYLLKDEASPPRGPRRRSRSSRDEESESSEASSTAQSNKWEGGMKRRGGNPSPWVKNNPIPTQSTASTLPPQAPQNEPAERPRRRRRRAEALREEQAAVAAEPAPAPAPVQPQPSQPSSLFQGMSFTSASSTTTAPTTTPAQPVVQQPQPQHQVQPQPQTQQPSPPRSNLLDFNAMSSSQQQIAAAQAAAAQEAKARAATADLSDLMAMSASAATPAYVQPVQQMVPGPGGVMYAQQFAQQPMVGPGGLPIQQMVQLPNGTFVPLQQAQMMMLQQQRQQQSVVQPQPGVAYGTSPTITPMVAPMFTSPPTRVTQPTYQTPPQNGVVNVPYTVSPSSSTTSHASGSAFSFVASPPQTASPGFGMGVGMAIPSAHASQSYADPFANVNRPDVKTDDEPSMNGVHQSSEEKSTEFQTISKPPEAVPAPVEEDRNAAIDIFGKLFHERQAQEIEKHYKVGDVVIRKGQYGSIHTIDYQTNPPSCIVRMHTNNALVNTEFSFITKAPEEMQPKTGEVVSTVQMGMEPIESEKPPEPEVDSSKAVLSIPDAWGFTNISRPPPKVIPETFATEDSTVDSQIGFSSTDSLTGPPDALQTAPTGFGFASGPVAQEANPSQPSSGFGFATGAPAQQVAPQTFVPQQNGVPAAFGQHQQFGQPQPMQGQGVFGQPQVPQQIQPQQPAAFGMSQQQPSAFGFAATPQQEEQPAPQASLFGFMNA